jgi:hypothetical protein
MSANPVIYQPDAEILDRPYAVAERGTDGAITRVVIQVCKRCNQPVPSGVIDPTKKVCKCPPPPMSETHVLWEPSDGLAESIEDAQYEIGPPEQYAPWTPEESAAQTEKMSEQRQDNGLWHNLEIPEGAPVLDELALHGIAGNIVRALSTETEAHPVGILVGLLQHFGNMIGASAYTTVEDTDVYGTFNSMKVGKSSKARKGTSTDRVMKITSQIDPEWFDTRQVGGLSSGEGLVEAVKDETTTSKNGKTVPVPGVADKRLMVTEGEAGGVLKVMGRDGSTLSATIRNATDHKMIGGLTKHDKTVCKNPHISIALDVTKDELLRELTHVDQMNGFGNRFFIYHVHRWNILPDGGTSIDWSPEIEVLKTRVRRAKAVGRIQRDAEANAVWKKWYKGLPDGDGIVAAMSARAERFVTVFSMLYALLDGHRSIKKEHLRAAIALWTYGAESVELIFGGVGPDQANILAYFEEEGRGATTKPDGSAGPLQAVSIRDIQRHVYAGRSNVDTIREFVDGLIQQGYVKRHTVDDRELFSRDWRRRRA